MLIRANFLDVEFRLHDTISVEQVNMKRSNLNTNRFLFLNKSDVIYFSWEKTAQLVSILLVRHDLPARLFSGLFFDPLYQQAK